MNSFPLKKMKGVFNVKDKVNITNVSTSANALKKHFSRFWSLYVMLIPVLAYYITFSYRPMYGIIIAFKDYKVSRGILKSEWVGFEHFVRLFSAYNFFDLLKNTLTLSVYSLVVSFPIPIIFALMLHYSTKPHLKKVVQLVSYAPHFISTVVICSMLQLLLHLNNGPVNILLEMLGGDAINFLGGAKYFKHIYVWSGVWQGMGWSAIIYISSLAGVDPALHEAAIIDGASKIQRMRYIDIPTITPTITMLLILSLSRIMNVGFEKVYLLKNDMNSQASSIISTYVYEQGLQNARYDYSTAVGLFNTIINVILLVASNAFCKKFLNESIF